MKILRLIIGSTVLLGIYFFSFALVIIRQDWFFIGIDVFILLVTIHLLFRLRKLELEIEHAIDLEKLNTELGGKR